MGEKLEIAVVKGKNISEAQNLYLRHEKEAIPYVELRKGKDVMLYSLNANSYFGCGYAALSI